MAANCASESRSARIPGSIPKRRSNADNAGLSRFMASLDSNEFSNVFLLWPNPAFTTAKNLFSSLTFTEGLGSRPSSRKEESPRARIERVPVYLKKDRGLA
jgi:hypothetical protein